ncbi:class I SAM-dependent methyltransferase [Candidatus Woesearchaeota archaeon]|nr:class I SAM-dependent methyltransferase [Candidatus Woesearchaeota archaeon]
MSKRKHDYTFVGRYQLLDRTSRAPGVAWPIQDVFSHFGSELSHVLSMGCSVGINEVILAIQNPSTQITCIDIDEGAIAQAQTGVWRLDDIRPSGFSIPSDNKTLTSLCARFCPLDYFALDFRANVLQLLRPVTNITFRVQDATQTSYVDSSFDLVMMHMLAGKICYPHSPSYVQLGKETERLLRPQGFFWNQEGLFKVTLVSPDVSPYRRVLHNKDASTLEDAFTPRESLFPGPLNTMHFALP